MKARADSLIGRDARSTMPCVECNAADTSEVSHAPVSIFWFFFHSSTLLKRLLITRCLLVHQVLPCGHAVCSGCHGSSERPTRCRLCLKGEEDGGGDGGDATKERYSAPAPSLHQAECLICMEEGNLYARVVCPEHKEYCQPCLQTHTS